MGGFKGPAALVTGALGGYPKKPKVPPYELLDVTEEQRQAIQGNIENLPELGRLAEEVNAMNYEEATKYLRKLVPGFDQILANVGQNLEAQSRGELPEDVVAAINRRAASQAVRSGTIGSSFAKFNELRNLGMTSLQATQQAIDSATRWMSSLKNLTGGQFDVTSMFVSPQQRWAMNRQQLDTKWGVDWLTNQIKAMPDPRRAAFAQGAGEDLDFWLTMAASYGMGGVGGVAAAGAAESGGGGGGGGAGGFTSFLGK